MSSYEDRPEFLAYRVSDLGKTVKGLVDWQREVDRHTIETTGDVRELKKDLLELHTHIDSLSTAFDGLRKTLLAFALTIAGSAIGIALTVLLATGKL